MLTLRNVYRRRVDPSIRFSRYLGHLKRARELGYRNASYADVHRPSRLLILRHDIDLDLGFAARMAQAEYSAGFRAHYFIMLHNDLYNPFGWSGMKILRQMVAQGHRLGLHFDPTFWNSPTMREMLKRIELEVRMLSDTTGTPVKYVSFHQPSPLLLRKDISHPLFEFVYNRKYTSNGVRYIADSMGGWREGSIDDLISSGKSRKIHFLAHPALWMNEREVVLNDRLQRLINEQRRRLPRYLEKAVNSPERGVVVYRSNGR